MGNRLASRSRVEKRVRGRSPFNLITDSGAALAFSMVDSPLFTAAAYAPDAAVSSWPNEIFLPGLAPLAQATGTKRPLYKPTALGGGPCALFDGTDDSLDLSTSITRGDFFVLVGAMLDAGSSTARNLAAFSTVGNDVTFGQTTGNNWTIRDDVSGPTTTASDTSPHIFLVRYGTAGVLNDLLVVDGVTVTDDNLADQATLNIITLGRATTQWSNCRIGGLWGFASDPRTLAMWPQFVARCKTVWGTAWV